MKKIILLTIPMILSGHFTHSGITPNGWLLQAGVSSTPTERKCEEFQQGNNTITRVTYWYESNKVSHTCQDRDSFVQLSRRKKEQCSLIAGPSGILFIVTTSYHLKTRQLKAPQLPTVRTSSRTSNCGSREKA